MEMTIARSLLDAILAAAAIQPDREICGLLFGDGESVTAVQPAANVSPNPADSFEIDPQALFAAIRAERAGGARLVGHYHSHPSGTALPSARDAAAAEAGRLWLIVAGAEVRLWRAEAAGRFVPVSLQLVGAPGCIAGT